MPKRLTPRRSRLAVVPLEDRTTPAVAFALSGTNLLSFDTANPTATQTTAITGVDASETLVGIDFRPQNGLLYGLGVNATANNASLYAISTRTGFATVVGGVGVIAYTTDGTTAVDLPDPATVGYGFDFNPAADRVRVVTASGLNFRVNPNTGAAVDGDLGGAAGSVAGINPDGAITGASTNVDGAAYTNSQPNNGGVTTQYTLDGLSNQLFVQNPPNSGIQTLNQTVSLGGNPLDFTAVGGFDIPAGVNAAASGAAVNTGSAFAVLNVGGTTNLYSINLVNAQATLIGNVGNGTTAVQGFTVQSDLGGLPAIALSSDGTSLLRFNTASPGTTTTQALNLAAVVAGETLVGIDFRPQTGQLYGLGVDATADTGTLYLIDPQTGALSVVGSGSQIAFVDAAGNPVDLPDPTATGYGFDFNPTADRIRVTTGSGLNFRVNPNTGAAVDGDFGGSAGSVAGTNPDASINGGGVTGVAGTAYTNSYGQSLVGGATTQYTLDPITDTVYIQNPPNAGTQLSQAIVQIGGGVPLDFTAVGGFDIPSGIRVGTSGNPALAGGGYAALTVGGVTNLYTVSLGYGLTTNLGAIGAGAAVAGLTLANAPAGAVSFTAATYTILEDTPVGIITVTRTGGTSGAGTVTVTPVIGTATGADLRLDPITLNFGDGQTSWQVYIPIPRDGLDEPNETFTVGLSNPTGGLVLGGIASATATIVDVDPPNGAVSFAQSGYSVLEGAGSLAVTLTRTSGSGGAVSVYIDLTAGTADASDLTLTPVLVTFADGQTTATANIPITDDALVEPDETFTLRLVFATGGLAIGAPNLAVGSIISNDLYFDPPYPIPGPIPVVEPVGVTSVGGRLTATYPDGSTLDLDPYPGFAGGFTVARGDVNGDGVADIITGAGAGGGSHVKVFSGRDGSVISSFFAYDAGFTGGVSVATGDVNGDGVGDIITGAGAGGNAHVKVFDGATGALIRSFFAYPGFSGGVKVAAGDVDGDGIGDIVTVAGPGGNGHVKAFSGRDGTLLRSFFAYPGFSGEVFIAAGDLDGDGNDEIVTGSGVGTQGHVKAFSGVDNSVLASFFAFEGFNGGARVAVADGDGDGVKDIIAGAGPGGGPHVKVFGLDGLLKKSSFAGDAGNLSGVFVG